MRLTPPSFALWLVSTVIVGFIIAIRYFGVSAMVPVVGPLVGGHLFEALLISFALLWAGCVFRGI